MQMENFAPVMFAGLIVIMLIGFPVAFSLSALGLASGDVHESDQHTSGGSPRGSRAGSTDARCAPSGRQRTPGEPG